MSSITSPVFTGVSSYAKDLEQVITRAVSIAALPLNQLQNHLQDLNSETAALNGLNDVFVSLQTAIQNLDSSIGPKSYVGASSDPTAATVSVGAGALEASYTLDITDPGSSSTSMSDPSLLTVTDPASTSISTAASFTLTVDGTPTTITPGSGSLTALAQAINASSAGVHASLVNIGSSGAPDYRLVLKSDNLGPVAIQLNDGSQDLLNTLNTGTLASYTVNGLATPIQSNSRTITLAPGVTVDLLQATPTGQPVTVTVSRDSSSASSAISAFVDAYNAAVDKLGHQVGKDSGILSGHSIVRELYGALRNITQFTTVSGSVTSLTRLGITLDQFGKLSFNSSQFDADSVDAIQAFLGSTSTGGFLKTASDALKSVEDPISGTLKQALDLVGKQTTRQNAVIAENTKRVDDFQNSLLAQMAAADALIATLESQRDYITNLFTAQLNFGNTGGVKSN